LTVALLPTPTKVISNDCKKPLISTRALSKMLGFSNGAGWRHISKASKKHKEISESNSEGWCMIDNDNICKKYSDTLLNDLEAWMNDNKIVRVYPNKGETILKRDQQGKIVRDPITKKPINVPKLLMTCNPRELQNHMISDFVGATDGDKVLISESKIGQILRSSCCHFKMITNRQKMMCGCETCIIFDDIHHCVNLFRKQYISTLKKANDAMSNE
jgi:hypothetical protein